MTRENYDLMATAVEARYHGDQSPFYYEGDNEGEIERVEFPIDLYLRKSAEELNPSENKMIELAYGDILDVGCGTGCYMPELEKKGKVLGIDFSEGMIKVSKLLGIENCEVQDFFEFNPGKQYDTITLFCNNIGMTGQVEGTRKLLKHMSQLLKDDGQILSNCFIAHEDFGANYDIMEIQGVWCDQRGPKFQWIHFSIDFLKGLCDEAGLKMEIVLEDEETLVRLTK